MSKQTVTLDVREDIRNGREPFGKIMQTVAGLKGDEQLRLIAPFEPAPLYAVLAQRGYSHQSKPTPEGDFEVLFTRGSSRRRQAGTHRCSLHSRRTGSQPRACTGTPVIEVDARGLEPPQPLVKILEALADLAGRRPAARAHRPASHAPVRPTGGARLRGRERRTTGWKLHYSCPPPLRPQLRALRPRARLGSAPTRRRSRCRSGSWLPACWRCSRASACSCCARPCWRRITTTNT